MKKVKALFIAIAFFVTTGNTFAQSAPGMIKEWERAKAYTQDFLNAMPDSGYAFKPTPEMRSFAQQMLHLTDVNYTFAAQATGEKSPVEGLEKSTSDLSKVSVSKIVLDGYDFVIKSIKKMKPEQLKESIKLFGRFDLTRAGVFEKAFEHQTHQRGQEVVYLRLIGVKAPQEKLF